MAIPFSRSERALEADLFGSRLWLFVGLLLLLAWLIWFFGARIGVYETSRRARVESSLAAHLVESPVAGRVKRSDVSLGRHVSAGDVLVELESREERTQLEEARAAMERLSAELEALRAEIVVEELLIPEVRESQRLRLEEHDAAIREESTRQTLDEKHLRRLASLQLDGLASDEDVEEAQGKVDLAAARIEQLRAARARQVQEDRLEIQERESRLHEIRRAALELQGRLDALAAREERYRHRLEERTVRAPVDGRLGEVTKLRPGSVLESGDAICTVVPQEETERIIAGFEPRRALGRLRTGQQARVRLDGFSWPEHGLLHATVESVGSEAELDEEGLVRVELTLDRPVAARRGVPILEHGLPGEVRVRVEQVRPVILLLRLLGAHPAASASGSQAAAGGDTVSRDTAGLRS